jgi:hypothetical protein
MYFWLVPSFIGLPKRKRYNRLLYLRSIKNRIIALVKYLDIYGRDFGINWFKRAIELVYDCARGDHTVRYTVWYYCTIPGKITYSPSVFSF